MNFFRPSLTLVPLVNQGDGGFALDTTTLVPTVAYVIAGSKPSVSPRNASIPPDLAPVALLVRKHVVGDVGHPVLRNHRVPKLNLAGKTGVVAFVCTEDDGQLAHVLGSAVSHVVRALPTLEGSQSVRAGDWGFCILPTKEGATLLVSGLVFTQTPGFSVSLVAKAPQGFNPKELLLDVVVKPSVGRWPTEVTPHTVQFQTQFHDHTGVMIFTPDGEATRIAVANLA